MKTIFKKWYYLLVLIPYGTKCLVDCEIISSFGLEAHQTFNLTLIAVILLIIIEIIIIKIDSLRQGKLLERK